MSNKILVVDDDEDIQELLSYNLIKEGYEVKTAPNGLEGFELAKKWLPDLIILDIMMPILDGIETGKKIKSEESLKNTHVVYLTARNEEFSEILAFEAGADDFLAKPIKPRALMSRINAFFRKEAQKGINEDAIDIAGIQINKQNYSVQKEDGATLVLPKKEFELLFHLAQYPNKVQGRDDLLQKVWGTDVFVVERTIDVHIRKLREKLGEKYIKTLKGVGYMFVNE
jgi:two-component system, OmpR family, alkaline phosphatase synthesis response regulator PhoP